MGTQMQQGSHTLDVSACPVQAGRTGAAVRVRAWR